MSPRPRTVDDAAVAMAFTRVIARLGPSRLTLAAIAREAGLSPATLIQRYGSKDRLLVELSKGAGDLGSLVASLRAAGRTPLDIVREMLRCFAMMAPSPQALTNSFAAYLEIDLAHATLRRYVVESTTRNLALMAALLAEAERAGAIRCPDPDAVARVLHSTAVGSLLAWAAFRKGRAADWLDRDLDAALRLLEPGRRGKH
ncbi:MAG: TetR/AcrR family transcriptional regulator [Gemmatimonadales bacterium]